MHNLVGHGGMDHRTLTFEKMIFSFNGPPILVESAFGGLGIYRRESIVGCRFYDATYKLYEKVNPKEAPYPCEHYSFHQCVRGSVYLHPALVVEWGCRAAPLTTTCPATFARPPPHYAAIDLAAEAARLYGTEGPFPAAYYLWPSPALHPPGVRINDTEHRRRKRLRISQRKEENRLKKCQGLQWGHCKGDVLPTGEIFRPPANTGSRTHPHVKPVKPADARPKHAHHKASATKHKPHGST